jgi:hypothetical protein
MSININMIQTIFGSPVVILKADDIEKIFPKEVNDEVMGLLTDSENNLSGHPYTRGGKILTTDLRATMDKDKINKLHSVLDFLYKTGLEYAQLFSDKPVSDLIFDNTWINLTFEGSEIKNHYDKFDDTKFKSLITLFYPKAPKGGSNLVFMHNSKYGEWASDCAETDMVKIAIEDGYVVIFDNSILHATDRHNVQDSRMCIAAEFRLVTE